jgi:hypothetical protein
MPDYVSAHAATDALLPLDALLRHMRAQWAEGDFAGAMNTAKYAAPYVHRPAQAAPAIRSAAGMTDEELRRWIAPADAADDHHD